MTISEQLREAALYSGDPYLEMPNGAFHRALYYRWPLQSMLDLSDTDLRTYMLLVAEALE